MAALTKQERQMYWSMYNEGREGSQRALRLMRLEKDKALIALQFLKEDENDIDSAEQAGNLFDFIQKVCEYDGRR